MPVQCVVLGTVLELFFLRDKHLAPLLDGLNGKTFRIHVRDMNTVMFLGFSRGKPWVHPRFDGEADVKIEATTGGFARLCFAHEDPDDLVFQQVLRLSGDSEAMLRFKKLLAVADLDWEAELRNAFGEFFGTRVAQAAHALVALEDRVSEKSHRMVGSYLQEIDVPDGERIQNWQAGVEGLSRNISRLKGRITRIEHRLEDLKKE